MIRFYLLALSVLTLGAIAAFYLHADAGYVLISYRNWLIETTLLGLVTTLSVGFLLAYYSFKLIFVSIRLPELLRLSAERRRAERARDSFESGLLKLLEGHWQQAEIELVRRAADHQARHLNYLGAARAAQRMGAGDRRDHYLKLAAQSAPELEFATQLTQAELQRERGEHRLARDTAARLHQQNPQHPYALELLAEAHAALGEWAPLRRLLADNAQLHALMPARYRELMLRALRELLARALAEAQLEQFKAVWDAAEPRFHQEPELRRDYAHGLARLNAEAAAAATIVVTLKKEWDADLVTLYGDLQAGDALGQLAIIEQWLSRYGEKPELLITAGRVCLRNKLWGKARSYLEAALRVAPTPMAYLELARLCTTTQSPDDAARYYRQGLELAARQ